MILPYYYWYYVSAIPPHICDQILELGISTLHDRKTKHGPQATNAATGGWKEKPLSDSNSAVPVNSDSIEEAMTKGVDLEKAYVRDSEVVFLTNKELFELVQPYVSEANKNAGWNFDWDTTEDFQFTKYSENQFYGWHTDCSDRPYEMFDSNVHPIHKNPDGTPFLDQFGDVVPENQLHTVAPRLVGKIRKLSCTISLNDPSEYEGGNLRFDLGPHRDDRYHTCTTIRPKGSVVIFPSFVYHQVTPVTKGTRYSLVCWNLGPPWK